MKKTLRYLKPYTGWIILIFILVALRALLELLLPLLMSKLLTSGLGIDGESTRLVLNTDAIIYFTMLMLGVALFSIIITIISGYLESKVASGFGRDLRNAVYKKVLTFSNIEMDHFTTSSLITRTTNDIQQLQSYINMLLRMIILQPVMAIGAIILAINLSPSLSMILVVSVVSLLFMIACIFYITIPRFRIMQKLIDRLNLVTRENLTGLRVVRAYNTQSFQEKRIDEASMETKRQNTFVSRVSSLMWPSMGFIMGTTSLAIVYFSRNRLSPDYTPEQMMTLMQYGMRTVMAFMMITMMFMMIPRASISAQRVNEILTKEIHVKETVEPEMIDFENIVPSIEFRNVEFRYPDAKEPVITKISFIANAYETTAIIGSTGSGKSTLINLVPRLYDSSEGDILIGDVPIKEMRLKDLHDLIGYVPQKGILFGGTIKENIGFGKKITDDEMIHAAEVAQARNFIESFTDQYDSLISQGGTNVSGGQRQRLSIARAIAKKPKIYIFDDSFSALDYQTDRMLRNRLESEISTTKLIVAQRINTIRSANKIIVLDQGHIVGIGTHNELMKTCSVYQEIASSQLSKDELEADYGNARSLK